MMHPLDPTTLVPMDLVAQHCQSIKIDLVYANAAHPENIFETALYHPQARLWLHIDLAMIVVRAARRLGVQFGWTLILKDGLRTIEAQERMMQTPIVQKNPQWLLGNMRLLSPPGGGAHPRAMAIDVGVADENQSPVDMGTPFDGMNEKSARGFTGFSSDILSNRHALEQAFMSAATDLSLPLWPLPSEWWDFRMPAGVYNDFAPLSDQTLPPCFRMTMTPAPLKKGDLSGFDRLLDRLPDL